MRQYKLSSVVILGLFITSLFYSVSTIYSNEMQSPNTGEVVERSVPRLEGGNSSFSYEGLISDISYNSEISPISGSGAEINDFQPRFDVGESNETHTWIVDPSNQTDGYYVEVGSGYQELNASRAQTSQHWYNETANNYQYSSGQLVNKTGVIDNTDWVIQEEYPNRFIIRFTNGSIKKYETVDDINNAFDSIDNSTLWAVGYESFSGVMGFYLNFADIDWGHAQYLYWPRLLNGQISAYNQPLYALYPHLYANYSGVWYDKLLNDRNLYDQPSKNPRNTLHFYNDSDAFGLYFNTYDIDILSSNWDFSHGFKYNFTDQLFHLITDIRCNDRDFDDIGIAYEITSSPQSDSTPYQPDRFLIANETKEVHLNISQAWEAGSYLGDFYSFIEVISQNNESFRITFTDMEDAGFTQKYLNLHDQIFPDLSTRKVLRVGMYGYGAYSQGTWINIDPPLGTIYSTDIYDCYTYGVGSTSWATGAGDVSVGPYSAGSWYEGFIAFDTNLDVAVTDIYSVLVELYIASETYDSGEGMDATVYNVKGNDNDDQAREDSQSYDNTAYYSAQTDVKTSWVTSAYNTLDATKMEAALDYWRINRDDDDDFISIHFVGNAACDPDTSDYGNARDSTWGGTDYDPKISFTYDVNTIPVAAYYDGMQNTYGGKQFATIRTDHTDPDGSVDVDNCHVYLGLTGVWYGATYNVDSDAVGETGSYMDWGSIQSVSEAGITDGFRLTWTLTLDWDFGYDDVDYDIYARTYDESAAIGNSDWIEAGTTTHENDLVVQTLDFELSDTAYSDDGDDDLNTDEWFRGGVGIRAAGTVRYEGASSVYPPDSIVNAQLWTDGTDRGDSYDVSVITGFFQGPYWTTISTSGIDTTYILNVTLQDYPSGAGIGTQVVTGYNVQRDNQIPIATSYTHADSNSGTGYTPQNGYDDDLVADYTINSPSDQSGSGLHATPYRYNWNGGGYGSYSTDTTPTVTVVDGQSADSDMQIRDKVGNVATKDGEDIIIDDDAPTSSSITETRVAGYPTNNAYLTGSTIYYDTGDNDYFTMSIDSSTVGNSLLWKTEVDVDGIFVAGMTTDATALPNAHNCNYLSRGSGTLRIRVVNNAGNYEELTYTATADNTPPVLTDALSGFSEDSGDDEEVFGVIADDEVFFSNSFDSACVVTMTATEGAESGSGIAGIDFGVFGADNPALDIGSPYTGEYTLNTDDTAGSINVIMYDNVGNSDSDTITMTEDAVAPSTYSVSVDADTTADIGYVPNTGAVVYYDDRSYTVTATVKGSITETGSGLPTNCYRFARNYGGWSAFQLSNLWGESLGFDVNSAQYIQVNVIDNVGNDDYEDSTNQLLIDTESPVSFTTTWTDADGWASSDYAYLSGTDIYFKNNAGAQSFNVQVNNDGTIQDSAFWKVEWDKSSLFIAGWNDTSGGSLPANDDFDYQGDGDATNFVIRVINNAGNYQTLTYTPDQDSTAPTTTAGSPLVVENSPNTYIYFDGSDIVYFSDEMGATDQLFTVTVTAGDTGGAGVYGVRMSAWDDETDIYDSDGTYERQYSTDSSETSGSITFTTYDQVGNLDASPVILTMTEDTVDPSISITWNFINNDYVTKIGSDFGFTNIDLTSLQDTGSGLDFLRININNGSLQTYRELADYSGDTDEKTTPDDNYAYMTDTLETTGVYFDDNYVSSDWLIFVYANDMVGNQGFTNKAFRLDRTGPTSYSLLMESGYFYSDITNDSTPLITVSGATDNGGSGLATNTYYYQWNIDDAGWSSYGWTSSGTHTPTITTSQNVDFRVQAVDVIGNAGSNTYDSDNTVDLVDPTIDTFTPSESSDYLYYSAGITAYYGSNMGSAQTFTFSGTSSDNYGLELVNGSTGFGDAPSDSSPASYSLDYTVESGNDGTVDVIFVLFDQAGNRDTQTFTFYEDNTAPSVNTLDIAHTTDTDDDGNNDIAPLNTYEDDLSSWSVSLSGSATDGGAGLPSTQYSFTIGAQSQSDWQSGTTFAYTSGSFTLAQGSNNLNIIVQDNVNNSATLDTVTIIADTDSPTGSNSYEEISQGQYIYNSSSTYLYYSNNQATFKVIGTIATHGGSGNYGVRFTDAFDQGANSSDTSDPYERQYQVNVDDSDTVLYIILYNNAGNSYEIEVTLDKDTTAPADGSNDITDIAESSLWLYDVGGTTDIWYGDDMPSGQSFTITVGTYADDKSGIYRMVGESFFGESEKEDLTADYSFVYSPSSGDTETGSLNITAIDNVGNYQIIDTITVSRDTTVDAPTIIGLSESSESLHTSGTSTFWYSEVMGATEQTMTISIGATDAGGSGVYAVEFPANWGKSEWNDTESTYARNYLFSSSDSDTGTITLYSHDNVGNTNSISFTAYKDTTAGTTTFWYFEESSFYITTSGSTIYYSDESFTGETITLRVKSNDTGANPSGGPYKVLFGAWDEQSASNDTGGSYWERDYTLDGDDTAGTITVKMYDNVGNLESSLIITVTRLTESPTFTITTVAETSEWLYNQSLTQFYYGDDMASAQTFDITGSVSYAGVDGISHVNTTITWFGDSPTDSSDPYLLTFTVENTDTDTGTLTVIVWTNTGKNGTDTITVTRDTTNPNAYILNSPDYDGDGNVTVTGSTTDAGSGMRTTNTYEWWVNATRDFGSGNWTNTGSYEFKTLLDNNHTFYAAAYDFVGNWVNATTDWTMVDFTAPEIYWTYLHTDETSAFYLETTNNTQQTIVYVYYNPSVYTFSVFLNFTAWDLVGGSLDNVTYNTRFGDSPANDTGDDTFYNATYTIEIDHSPEDSGEQTNGTKVVVTAVDNVGLTATVIIWFYRDLDAPTLDLTIDDDPDALLDLGSYYGWYNDTTVDTSIDSPVEGDHPPNSGFPTDLYAYKYNSSGGDNSYGSWESIVSKQQTVDDTGTWWLWVKVRDLVDNYREYNVTAYVDLVDPVINSVTFSDESYAPNWYKEEDVTASFDTSWTETNAYLVNASQSLLTYQQNDNDPSGSTSSFSATISGASHGYYNLTLMAYDNAGNRVIYNTTLTENIRVDNNIPSISWLSGSTSESSTYLYFDGSTDEGYYSDKMGGATVDFTIGGSASDSGSIESGMSTLVDNTGFGDNPSNTGTLSAWIFIYSIDQNDNGDITITYTATDNVGNTNTDTFDFYEDTANPSITWQSSKTNESSSYMYYDGSSQYGYYSDNMGGSTNNFIIGGIASDSESDLYTITDSTAFGNNPSNTGTVDVWAFVYAIDQDDDSYGTFTLTFTATDLVNNTATDTFQFRLDNTNPAISLTTGSISESSDYLYYDGSSSFGYYSDNMVAVTKDFSIYGTTSDGGSALNTTFGTVDDTSFGNNPSNTGTTSSWIYVYAIDDADSSYGTFSVTYEVIDYCNNTNTVQFQFREDNTNPIITWLSAQTNESTTHLYYDSSSQDGYYSDNMEATLETFNIGGTGSDGGSGLYVVEDNATFGNNPTNIGSASLWSFNYSIDQSDDSDGSFNITYTIKDNVNNSNDDWFYFYLDNTNPTISLDTGEITETSPYLYYDGSSAYGFYSDNMQSSLTNFIVNGSSTDSLSGLLSLTDNTTFGDNPSNTGSIAEWEWTYQIDSSDSGNEVIEYQITDNCNNNNTVIFIFYEDTTPPSGTFTLTQDTDALVNDWDNDTTINTILSSLSDGSSPPASDYNSTYPVRYKLDSGNWGDWNNTLDKDTTVTEGTRTLYIAFHDYCNNTVQYSVTVYVDLTDPVLGILEWKNPTYSFNWYRAIDNTANWNVTWTETNPYLVNGSNVPLGYTENDSNSPPSGSVSDFVVTITGKSDGYHNITVTIFDNAGNRDSNEFTGTNDQLKIDNTGPTVDFDLFQNAQALVNNYYPSLIAYTNTSNWDDGTGSGFPALFIAYRKEGYGWNTWTDTADSPWAINDQTNVSIYCKIRDNMGWESTVREDWVIGDTIAPVLGWLTLNETYAPNWYDQSESHTAQAQIYWTEAYPFDVDATCTLSHSDDNSPSGGVSYINFTITGEADGSYSVLVRIRDNAGNEDTTLAGSEAPIQLRAGMSGFKIEDWIMLNYYDPEGFLIEWNTFNTSFVIDENYRNYTEQPMLNNEMYANITSSIRVITRSIFNDVIYNQTSDLSGRTLFLILSVYTLKVSNIHDEVMNMTITKATSTRVYTEQVMPYEIFGWEMYIGSYNITVLIHGTNEYAFDESNNELNNFTLTLTDDDYAMFIDANLRFTVDMIISEIWQFNIFSNKDYKTNLPSFDIYLNTSSQGSGDFDPGTIVLSRPQVGYYNLTIYGEWQNYNDTYMQWVTIESNARATNFVVSGLESTSDEIYISWNTNKGTGTLTIYDNTSLVQTNALEGNSMLQKSESIGLHELEFNITVETKVLTYYANYTVADWTVSVSITLYSSSTPTVSMDKNYVPTVTVTRSDGEYFSGYVWINGTDYRVTVVNNIGTFYMSRSDTTSVASVFWNVSSVQEVDTTSREFVSTGLTVIFDKLSGHLYSNGGTGFTVIFNSSYTGETIDNIRYKVTIGNVVVASETQTSFDIADVMSNDERFPDGIYQINCTDPEDLSTYVKVGDCNTVTYTKSTPLPTPAVKLAENIDTGIKTAVQVGIAALIIGGAGAIGYKVVQALRRKQTTQRSSGNKIFDANRQYPKQKKNDGKLW